MKRYEKFFEAQLHDGNVFYPNGKNVYIDDIRCTNLTLHAFGICVQEEIYSFQGVDSYLKNAGYHLFDIKWWNFYYKMAIEGSRVFWKTPDGREVSILDYNVDPKKYREYKENMSVAKFAQAFPKGKYVLGTPGHSLALINGVLWDFARKGFDRRRVEMVSEVMTKNEWERVAP